MFCLGISPYDLLIYGIEDKSACAVGGETEGLLVKSKRRAGKSDSENLRSFMIFYQKKYGNLRAYTDCDSQFDIFRL